MLASRCERPIDSGSRSDSSICMDQALLIGVVINNYVDMALTRFGKRDTQLKSNVPRRAAKTTED